MNNITRKIGEQQKTGFKITFSKMVTTATPDIFPGSSQTGHVSINTKIMPACRTICNLVLTRQLLFWELQFYNHLEISTYLKLRYYGPTFDCNFSDTYIQGYNVTMSCYSK